MNELILSNPWWDYIVSTYTYTIGLVIGFIIIVLKCIAIWHPDEKTNSIVGLIMGWLGGFPGAGKWNGLEERRKDIARAEIAVDRKEIAVNRKETDINKQEIKENEEKV